MARIPYADTSVVDSALLADIKAQRGGKLLNLYRMLLHSPALARGWLALLTAIRQQCRLDPRHRELVVMRIAVLNGADYEYAQHVPHALAAGLTEADFTALHDWPSYPGWEAADRAALAYTDAITRDVHVPDPVFAEVRAHFSEPELVELTATIAAYNLVSRFVEALAIDHD
jgi:alkylhydroperoxidase family enzyme